MAKLKSKTLFSCQQCGAQYPKWQGRCNDCGQWNTIVEEIFTKSSEETKGWAIGANTQTGSRPKSISLGEKIQEQKLERWHSGIGEFDRVLGGGLVPASFLLLGGDPGIGKSTILLQVAGKLAQHGKKILYVSSEESVEQTGLRAQRLGVRENLVHVASENNLDAILNLVKEQKPNVLVVDSIQTVFLPSVTSAPGSVSQVRECAGHLMMMAKNQGIAVFLIGHVTKDGSIAGPKVLEHMVDTVLSFEGDTNYDFRILRSLKNRFGPANQLGVFQMAAEGLEEIANPSELFLEKRDEDLIGSVVFPSMEGNRPLLCEIQALVTFSPMPNPRRTTMGISVNRIHLLAAVLDKYLNYHLQNHDIYVNVVGGLKLEETATDLAIAAALLSSEGNQPVDGSMCFFGEIGLTGEVRGVAQPESRILEAHKLGFKKFVVPVSNQKHLKALPLEISSNILYLKHIRDIHRFFSRPRKTNANAAAAGKPNLEN